MRAHREAAMRRMVQSGKTILAVQDTAGLNYNTQTKMEGIGYVSDKTLGGKHPQLHCGYYRWINASVL